MDADHLLNMIKPRRHLKEPGRISEIIKSGDDKVLDCLDKKNNLKNLDEKEKSEITFDESIKEQIFKVIGETEVGLTCKPRFNIFELIFIFDEKLDFLFFW